MHSSEEKALAPRIRFAGFTDPWEQRKLGDDFAFLRNNTLSRADLSDSEGSAFDVHYGDLLVRFGSILDLGREALPHITDDGIAAKLTCDRLRDGDIVVVDTAEDLTAGKCSELRGVGESTVFSGLHTMPLRPLREYAPLYLGHYLNAPAFRKQLLPLMQGIKVISVSRAAMSGAIMSVPSVEEQGKIAGLLSRLDDLIALHQRKCDGLKTVKKSLLEKMFPREGEAAPEVRFAGFTDPWEQRKLSDFVTASGVRNKDGLPIKSYSVSNDRGFVPQDEQFEKGGTMHDADKTAYWIVEPGSFAYNPARINVGSIGYLSTSENVIVSSLYEVFRADATCDDRFLWHWFKSPLFMRQIEMLQEGGVRLYFFFDKLLKSEIRMPKIAEQVAIGQCFDSLDDLIALHQRKLDALKNVKKSLLEGMFV